MYFKAIPFTIYALIASFFLGSAIYYHRLQKRKAMAESHHIQKRKEMDEFYTTEYEYAYKAYLRIANKERPPVFQGTITPEIRLKPTFIY